MKPHHPMDIQGMKVHHLITTRAFWEHEPPSLTLGCKRLRPLAPRVPSTTTATDTSTLAISTTTPMAATFSLKSFIRPESGPRKIGSSDYPKKDSAQVEAVQPGGTRWNPTEEQIGILEMLYRSGMRTPNAQQIEQITAQLAKYGRIEGKNVFYWFQNHKARERQKQKQKRNGQGHSLSLSPRLTNTSPLISNDTSLLLSSSPTNKGGTVEEELESSPYKRKCRSWAIFDEQCFEEDNRYCTQEQGGEDHEEAQDRTLKLFPLHPEGRF